MHRIDEKTMSELLLVLDLAGTLVFAISGAMLACRADSISSGSCSSFVASSAGELRGIC